FLEPVDPNYVPDYLKVIKSPMDFSTMQKKLDSGQYKNVDDFRQDFNLIVSNAKLYNAIDTIYWKSADKL
ncbi:Bromodomain-containing protein, partial [Rhizopus microsporus ATCC 52813]